MALSRRKSNNMPSNSYFTVMKMNKIALAGTAVAAVMMLGSCGIYKKYETPTDTALEACRPNQSGSGKQRQPPECKTECRHCKRQSPRRQAFISSIGSYCAKRRRSFLRRQRPLMVVPAPRTGKLGSRHLRKTSPPQALGKSRCAPFRSLRAGYPKPDHSFGGQHLLRHCSSKKPA